MKYCTGWPKSKFEISFGYISETMHFWPIVGKAKMRFRGVYLFWFFSSLFTIFKINVRLSNRLSQKNKKFEYQKSLLTLDVGWLDKLSCKISASYLENRKSSGCLKFQRATNKIKKSLFSKIDFYFKKLWFFYLKMDYESICWCTQARNTKILILANFLLFLLLNSLLKLKMARWFSVFKIGCWNFAW